MLDNYEMLCCGSAIGLHKIKLCIDCKAKNVSVTYFNYKCVWTDHSSFNMWFDTFVLQVHELLRLVCQIRLYCCYIIY